MKCRSGQNNSEQRFSGNYARAAWFLLRIVGMISALDWACRGHIFFTEETVAAARARHPVIPMTPDTYAKSH